MRYLFRFIQEDLKDKKMAFVGGPRQVGKTTLALQFLAESSERSPGYLSWDSREDRLALMKEQLPSGQNTVVLDEIHKFPRWRNLVKGLYDKNKSLISFIVTGSARLDYYRRGGDSLQGRYHYHRLHPFSLCELNANPTPSDLQHLMKMGGFPEPLFKGSEKTWKRWQSERAARVLTEDLTSLEKVKETSLIELLMEALPGRVGAPLSVKALREELEVAHDTAERWIQILERLYFCYRIAPFGSPKIRAVKKERKLYLWDWSQVPEPGFRFENLVASQLLKYCHFREDTEGDRMELRFLRDTDQREVDFVVLKGKQPLFAVECKCGEKSVAPSTSYFRARTAIPKFYQVHLGQKDFGNESTGTRVLPFVTFCKELGLP